MNESGVLNIDLDQFESIVNHIIRHKNLNKELSIVNIMKNILKSFELSKDSQSAYLLAKIYRNGVKGVVSVNLPKAYGWTKIASLISENECNC